MKRNKRRATKTTQNRTENLYVIQLNERRSNYYEVDKLKRKSRRRNITSLAEEHDDGRIL